jgi:hypothetical protein
MACAGDDGFRRQLSRHGAGRSLRGRLDTRCTTGSRPAATRSDLHQLPCALHDAAKAVEHLKAKLGIDFGETTLDGLFTLKEGECFGACGDAPVLLVNNKRMCSWMVPEKLDALLGELRAEAPKGGDR